MSHGTCIRLVSCFTISVKTTTKPVPIVSHMSAIPVLPPQTRLVFNFDPDDLEGAKLMADLLNIPTNNFARHLEWHLVNVSNGKVQVIAVPLSFMLDMVKRAVSRTRRATGINLQVLVAVATILNNAKLPQTL